MTHFHEATGDGHTLESSSMEQLAAAIGRFETVGEPVALRLHHLDGPQSLHSGRWLIGTLYDATEPAEITRTSPLITNDSLAVTIKDGYEKVTPVEVPLSVIARYTTNTAINEGALQYERAVAVAGKKSVGKLVRIAFPNIGNSGKTMHDSPYHRRIVEDFFRSGVRLSSFGYDQQDIENEIGILSSGFKAIMGNFQYGPYRVGNYNGELPKLAILCEGDIDRFFETIEPYMSSGLEHAMFAADIDMIVHVYASSGLLSKP
jgi:hypothetical protein